MTSICSKMCCCQRTFSRCFGEHVWISTSLNLYTTTLHLGAALRLSRVDLELITDENIYNLNENSIRGGISMILTRHARANNHTRPDTYDSNLPNQNLIYLDANNLYGCAMSQYLPTHGFRLLSDDAFTALKLEDLRDDGEDGYIYVVDLHYPTELRNAHDDYPLAPESLVIDQAMYSPTRQSVFPESPPQTKLTPNLRDKTTRYGVHYRNLKLYVQVHSVLKFKQSPWLKKTYIDFNTRQRSLADNGFLKDFFKLMNNSVFGKTQENLRKRVQVDLVTDANVLRKRIAKPSFCRGVPITDCLTVVQCKVQTLIKPPNLRWIYNVGAVKASHVRFSLQPHENEVSTCRIITSAVYIH